MDKILSAWSAQVQKQFETKFCRPPGLQTQLSRLSDRSAPSLSASYVNVDVLLQWLRDEVNRLLCDHAGVAFWSHFDWFDPASVEDENFTDKLTQSMIEANGELLKVKNAIMLQFESICEEPLIQATFSAPDNQRRFLRTLHHLETLWHLVVLPSPAFKIQTNSIVAGARTGIWRKFIFHCFSTQFDLLRSDSPAEDSEALETSSEPKTPTEAFLELVSQLNRLALIDASSDVLQALLLDKIQHHVNSKLVGVFSEENQLARAKEWVEKDCLGFLALVQCLGIELDTLNDKLNELSAEKDDSDNESLRVSQDSDLEDQFVFKPGFKRVPSTPHRIAQLGYPTKDPTMTIKRPYGRGITPYGKREIMLSDSFDSFSSSDSDSEILLMPPTQPDFSSHSAHHHHHHHHHHQNPTKEVELFPAAYPVSPVSVLNSGRASPIRPSSPMGRNVPSSPIPMSASLTPMADWMSKNTVVDSVERKECRLKSLVHWRNQLFKFLYEISSKLRISELFDLIVDYPDSTPAVRDLKTCLDATQQYGDLVVSLRAAIKRRLLLPGATNADIVAIYISTIRTIRELDPSNVLLGHVTVDLREYLRTRPDSVKAIVLLLTEDGSESGISLLNELEESTSLLIDDHAEIDSDGDDGDGSKEWTPAPIIRAPSLAPARGLEATRSINASRPRYADLISMLVSVHGSKEFTDKYADLLAERLLLASDFTSESEVKNVELLKLKFGENALLKCEVMLKDMAESKRINTGFQRESEQKRRGEEVEPVEQEPDHPISAAILSTLFWPDTSDPITTTLPHELQAQREAFEKYFSSLKSSRSLTWHDTKGTVELELSFIKDPSKKTDSSEKATSSAHDAEEEEISEEDAITVAFTVNPLQASIIMRFEDQEELTIEQIAAKCKVSPEIVKYGISYWINAGVVLEPSEGVYKLSETLDPSAASNVVEEVEDAGEEVETNAEQFIPFIVAMLKNLGAFPLNKIHSRLQNLYDEYTLTLPQLSDLLDGMVKSDTIELRNGLFGLIKK
jgi:anaphase-promoting complex subunit 2